MHALMLSATPLHGRSDQDVGIQECYTLVSELKKVKAKGVEGSNSSISQAANDAAGEKQSESGLKQEDDAMDGGVMLLDTVDSAECDPVQKAIQQAAEKQFDGIRWFQKLSEVEAALSATVFPNWHVLFVVDCYTSRPKVCMEYLKSIKAWTDAAKINTFKVAIPIGRRFDLLDRVDQKLRELWPKMGVYTMTLYAQDNQTVRQRCTYVCVVVVGKDASNTTIPVPAPLSKSRAKKQEGLRMRYMKRDCQFRSAAELARLLPEDQVPDPGCEIEPDDCECADDAAFEEDMDAEGAKDMMEEDRNYLIDLWCFSRPETWYTGLLNILGATQAQMVVVASTTAHPSAAVAARNVNLPVFFVVDRVSHHSFKHGEAIAMQRFEDTCLLFCCGETFLEYGTDEQRLF